MSGMRSRGWALAWAGLLLTAATLVAADAKKDASKESAAEGGADVTDLGTAFQLIEYGRAYKAPEALATAAGLLLSVSRAEMKDLDLDGKLVVEGVNAEGKPQVLNVEPKATAAPDLKKEAASLLDEAELMALKQKTNLAALVKEVKKRGAANGPAGVVKRFARTVEPGQTQVLRVKTGSDEATDLAFRATTPLLVSVVRVDNNSTLASTLTGGGNIHFKPELGVKTRGVVVVKKKVVVARPVVVVRPPVRVVKKVVRYRGVGEGDCPILIRIHNPSEEAVPYALYVN